MPTPRIPIVSLSALGAPERSRRGSTCPWCVETQHSCFATMGKAEGRVLCVKVKSSRAARVTKDGIGVGRGIVNSGGLGWDGMGWVGLGWGWSKVASRIHHWVRFSVPRLGSTIYLGVVYSLVSFSLYVSQGDGGQPMQVATSRSRD